MSFLKGIIDKVEGVAGNHQQQNAQHSSSPGFNPQQQHGGPWSHQGKTIFDAHQQEQYYGEIPFLGPPPHNPYQDGYQQQGPPGSYPYQEGYGRSAPNYQGGPPPPYPYSQPPPYENRGQLDMPRQQWGGEHHRDHFPHQFENREPEHHHNHGHHEGHERGRNHSPGERRYEHHPEGHGHGHNRGHGHGHHQEHERRRSHSRD